MEHKKKNIITPMEYISCLPEDIYTNILHIDIYTNTDHFFQKTFIDQKVLGSILRVTLQL